MQKERELRFVDGRVAQRQMRQDRDERLRAAMLCSASAAILAACNAAFAQSDAGRSTIAGTPAAAQRNSSHPDPNSQARNAKALQYLKMAQSTEVNDAMQLYAAQAILLDPNLAEAYMMRALALQRKRRYPESVIDASHAIKLNPRLARAYVIRAKAGYLSGDAKNEEVFKDLHTGLKLNPKVEDGYLCLAVAYAATNDGPKALDAFAKALAVKPSDKNIYHYRSGVYSTMGKHALAVKDLDTYLKLAPKDAHGYVSRASARQLMGNNEGAIADYSRAIELDAREYTWRLLRAALYKSVGRHKEAIGDYSEAIKGNPIDEELFYRRGLEYFSLKQYDKALADYNEAIDLNKDFQESYRARSELYDATGKHALAAKDRARANELKARPAEKKI